MALKLRRILAQLIIVFLVVTLATPAMLSIGYADSTDSAQEQEKQTEENINDELDFLYIESKELEAPGTQNIAISWGESITRADKLELVYADSNGKQYTVQETDRTDSSVLFSEQFSPDKKGTYVIKGVNYVVGETTGFFEFNSVEIKATFTVVDNIIDTPVKDNIASAEQSGSKVDSDEIKDQITDTLAAANVPETTVVPGEKVVVVLDPGHGSLEAGASGNGLQEYKLNYKIAQYCKSELETYEGVEVYLTHNGTGFSGTASERLQKRVNVAVSKNADVLVSLHINATGTGTSQGAEVWYPNKNYKPAANTVGKALSQDIQNELVKLGLYNRGIKEKSTVEDKYPDGSLQDWYGIIRLSKMAGIPGIIVEHAFIDNSSDANKFLSSDSKLKALGVADATGISSYFGLTKKTSDADSGDSNVAGWITEGSSTKYMYEDGTYATGYVKIDGSYYYFSTSGIMQKYDQTINGVPYYFGSNGKAASTGWLTTNTGAKKYCLGNGKMATGYVKIGYYYYGFSSSGVMQRGTVTMNNKRYVFASSGIATLYTAKTKANLNYRTGPSTGYGKKGTLKKGTVVSITRTQNGWGQMTNGYWVKLSYVSKATTYPQSISTTTTTTKSSTYKVKLTANVNYRTGPSTKYARRGTYKKGTVVSIKKTQSGWGQMTNGYWIKLSYTKKV